jgi:hypothetical protein
LGLWRSLLNALSIAQLRESGMENWESGTITPFWRSRASFPRKRGKREQDALVFIGNKR